MHISKFKQHDKSIEHPRSETEAMWDSRAAQFSLAQQADNTGFPDKVTRLLTEKGYIKDQTVLDIGGGTGRYALPFAQIAKSVTLTDLSTAMLQEAQKLAQKARLSNLRYQKLDWEQVQIEGSSWEKSHDLVFASMCPALRSEEGLIKMSQAARKAGVINQFIKTSDSLIDQLKAAGNILEHYDPHNDRDIIQTYFKLLWDAGYEVQLYYHHYQSTEVYTIANAAMRYGGRFAAYNYIWKGQQFSLADILALWAVNGQLEVHNETVLATIIWEV
ncbi:MAG: class I SAM-dependent methyltransferase [Oscillospiraceae bacterium]|nr:class I SAM-dependent methyltransferase [Oscillospiraceae bacterium]MDD4368844.1 class I SAM-dependent methyltransferase [Oscillospiraceae bacterium]